MPSLLQLRARPKLRHQWLALAALGACTLGCSEDVLVVDWQLRSLSDAGISDEADGGNPQSRRAEEAREAERERDDKPDGHDRPGNEDKAH